MKAIAEALLLVGIIASLATCQAVVSGNNTALEIARLKCATQEAKP